MPALKRKTATGEEKEFKYIGNDITPTESLKDKWANIPSTPSMTQEDEKILLMLEERLSAAKQAQLRRIDVWNASYLQYRSVNYYTTLYGGYPTYWNQWGANAFIPRTFEVVEGARAQLKSRIPDWTVKPTERKWVKYSENVHKISHSEWRRSHSQNEAVEALDDAIIWGRGIVENTLFNDVRQEQSIGFDKNGNVVYTAEDVTKYYGVGSVRIDPYDFFPEPNPDAVRINAGPSGQGGLSWCFKRTIADVEDIRNYFKNLKERSGYGVTDNWQYLKPGGDLTDYKYLRTHIDDLYRTQGDIRYPATVSDTFGFQKTTSSMERAYTEGKIELWTYYERDRKIIFAQGLILQDSPNPFPHKVLPFSGMTLFETKTFWSMGLPEVMRWLQIVENTLYDHGLNNIVMNVHKMFAVNNRYLEDEGELVVRPFGIVHLKNIPGVNIKDAIQPIEFTPLFQDYFNFLSLNKSNIQTLTGSSEFATGGVTKESKIERATVANRIVQGGLIRSQEIARHFEQQLVSEAVEQHIAIMQLYYQIELGGADSLDIEVSGAVPSYLKFIPKNEEDLSDEEIEELGKEISGDNAPYSGYMTLDAIQGRYMVEVRGGSSVSLDPDEESRLRLQFLDLARTLTDPDKAIGRDEKGNYIGAPIFDIKKLAIEAARDVYKLQNPEDFIYKTPDEKQAEGGVFSVDSLIRQPFQSLDRKTSPIEGAG